MEHITDSLKTFLKAQNELIKQLALAGYQPDPIANRASLELLTQTYVTTAPSLDLTKKISYKDIPLKIYHPEHEKNLPVFLYLHGGGHMSGSIDVYDKILTKLAFHTGNIVVAVDYKLAPEHPFPSGLNDCKLILKNMWNILNQEGINFEKSLTLGGDSAGGALSSTICHTELVELVDKLVLIYPSLDYTLSCDSIKDLGKNYLLETHYIKWLFDNYFQNNENRYDESPLFRNIPENYPDTLIITAGFDPLKSEGIKYFEKLEKAKIDVKHIHFPGMIHAFLNLENLVKNQCDKLYNDIGLFLKES
ncbi:carboxylesterase [Paraphotobacterium marinum]|uniref:Carboxylesterase n=1 Tax=Paraphotobacterium marinum TaxID=1755811 RepID=A0A220VEV0_9GAMM|nr:alpha/beta hydrolase [Paraphotobacterium marinum]ASK78924.1 carboxylesterase [Paraphotobacterium marinum]